MITLECVEDQATAEAVAEARYRAELLDLLQQEHYSADELAALLEVDVYLLEEAANIGELPATMIDGRILDISRADVLHWLADPV